MLFWVGTEKLSQEDEMAHTDRQDPPNRRAQVQAVTRRERSFKNYATRSYHRTQRVNARVALAQGETPEPFRTRHSLDYKLS